MEDLNTLRMNVATALKINFQRGYQFRVSFAAGGAGGGGGLGSALSAAAGGGGGSAGGEMPAEFDFFCKSVAYPGIVKIDTDDLRVGAGAVSLPQKKEIGEVTLTFLDSHDRRITEWLRGLAKKVFNEDGTVNPPSEYTLEMTVYLVDGDGQETEDWKGHVFLTDVGEVTRAYSEGGLVENTATFIEAEV